MNGTTIIWIVVAAATLVILAALLAGAQSKTPKPRAGRERQEAHEHEQQPRTAIHGEKQQPAVGEPDEDSTRAQHLWPESEPDHTNPGWDDGTHPHDPRHPNRSKH